MRNTELSNSNFFSSVLIAALQGIGKLWQWKDFESEINMERGSQNQNILMIAMVVFFCIYCPQRVKHGEDKQGQKKELSWVDPSGERVLI